LESLAIDEADLIFSYGHDEDISQIFGGQYLPKVFQSYLMSATMTEDVEALKGLTLRNPVNVDSSRSPGSALNNSAGNIETGRGRRRVEKPDTILRPVFGGRQIPVDVRHPETEAGHGEMHHIRERCGEILSPQVVPGAILNQKLCFKLGIAAQLKVCSKPE